MAPRTKRASGLTAAQKKAQKLAEQGGYVDANLDGVPDPDPLSREELAAQYQSALGLIYSVPEISAIFEQAVQEQWVGQGGIAKFNAAIQNSDWYRSNNEYFRNAWAAEHFGQVDGQPNADWQAQMETAREVVRLRAAEIGSQVTPEALDALARRYLYEGWGAQGRTSLMDKALSETITYVEDGRGMASLKGQAGNLSDTLKNIAMANGVNFSDNWYLSAAQSVASQLTTAEDWERDIREQAAGLYPVYAEKIKGGMNVYDLASPYIRTMADELELGVNDITLNDPYIREALTGVDENGNPKGMDLWAFTRKVRQDPRWMNTTKAQNEVTSVTGAVMQMFGLMGG